MESSHREDKACFLTLWDDRKFSPHLEQFCKQRFKPAHGYTVLRKMASLCVIEFSPATPITALDLVSLIISLTSCIPSIKENISNKI